MYCTMIVLLWTAFLIGLISAEDESWKNLNGEFWIDKDFATDYVDDGIRYWNEIRSWHGAPPLKRHPNPKFHHDVQQYAERLANDAGWKGGHSSGVEWMENLFGTGNRSPNKSLHAITATRVFYSEIRWYDFNAPTGESGHFTCMIWKGVTHGSYGVATNDANELTIVVQAVWPYCNMAYFDSYRAEVRAPVDVLSCMKGTAAACHDVAGPKYSACLEPYHDQIRCLPFP